MPLLDDPFDPARLRLNGTIAADLARPFASTKPPRHRPGELFLKGPIPWRWLEQAARLPGKALSVSLVLWREAGRRRRRTIPISLASVGLGLSKWAARRALRQLDGAGLVSVRHLPGKSLQVTINDATQVQNPTEIHGNEP